jgi:ABC-type multidrug transport system ATPase subunit
MLEIRLEGLSRSFAEREVIRDLSAVIPAGERCVVRGPNGSGKTTLLKIVAGVLVPTGGRVRVNADGAERDAAWIRRWTGFMGPDLFLYDELSAAENLDFFAAVRGLPRDPGRERRILEQVRLDHRRDDPIRTLSTGLRQRAKLAFAIQADPRILLLDEPSSNLDREGRDLVKEVVDGVTGQDRVVIIATNDPEEREWGTKNLDLD